MPIYEYECTECGLQFDLRRSIDDDDSEAACPGCEAGHPRRLVSTCSPFSAGGSCAPIGGG